MPEYTLISLEYPELFSAAVKKRLSDEGISLRAVPGGFSAAQEELSEEFLRAVSETLERDLMRPEMKRLLRLIPVDAGTASEALPRAARAASAQGGSESVFKALREYLSENRLLIAEGFLRFRAPFLLNSWAAALDRAAGEVAAIREREGFLALLGIARELGAERERGDVRLVIYEDGSWTLTDPGVCFLESDTLSSSELLPMLVSLAPDRLEVYDLTEGGCASLIGKIAELFGRRARIFVKRSR
jgi:hypothetical protein